MQQTSGLTDLRWKLAGWVHRLPDVRGRDRISHMLIGGQPRPSGIHRGTFGPDLHFEVSYEEDGSMVELFFLQYELPSLAPVVEACLSEGGCFFDVGGNIGIYSSWAARQVGPGGQVHTFEPIPTTRELLAKTLGYNKLDGVHVEPTAVGNEVGTVRMYRRPGGSGTASAALHKEGDPFVVPLTTLDAYVAKSGCAIPDLIKIDVEGLEQAVLEGASGLLAHPDAPAVVYEQNAKWGIQEFIDIAPLFEANGYHQYGLCTSGLERVSDVRKGPPSLNILAVHPERHADVIERLKNKRFRRNQNT